MSTASYLTRYSDITALVYMLHQKCVTLLDPASWQDRNDSYYIAAYKERLKLKSVLALCFTKSSERFHYWRVFGAGSSGISIRFKRAELIGVLRNRTGVAFSDVRYVKLDEGRSTELYVEELPFVKRYAFKHESEFRVLYKSKTQELNSLDIRIPLSCIQYVTLSPWLHMNLYPSVVKTLQSIDGCDELDVRRSTLISNDEWKDFADRAIS